MNKKEHLRKLLNIEKGNPSYAEMNTEIKSYNKFIRDLKLNAFNKVADNIFKDFYCQEVTLKSITAKKRGKEFLESKLVEFAKVQEKHYKNVIYPPMISEILTGHRVSDADIIRVEHKNKHSITLTDDETDIFSLDLFMLNFRNDWTSLNLFIDETLNLVFNYNTQKNMELINVSQFKILIEETIQEYINIKDNHQNVRREVQTLNPYLNLYIYCRNVFILDYFKLTLPNYSLFKEFKNLEAPLKQKELYSLGEVSDIYKFLVNKSTTSARNVYENMKKNFQGSRYMQRFKNNKGEYVFSNLSIPIAYYIYYRKKNHNPEQDLDYFINNHIIENRVAPVINAKFNADHERIEALNRYINFIEVEFKFKDIFSTINHRYQTTMINFLAETIVNLFYRCSGLSKQNVYNLF